MKLDALRTQALQHLVSGDFAGALRIQAHLIARLPADLDARMRVGDLCVQIRQPEAAKQVYAAVAYLDMQGGRPLHALVAMQALSDLGEDVGPLREALGSIYGAGSARVAKVGARLAPPPPDTDVGMPPPEVAALAPQAALQLAVSLAAETRTVREFPPAFQPVPLLSDLSGKAFARLIAGAAVHRLGHGQAVLRKGEHGDAFYLVASGQVRVHTTDEHGQPIELARLSEGAIFGEMALIRAEPRSASVEVVGAADLIAFGRGAIQAAADELPALAAALDRFTRDRLLKNLLTTSPLFRPFEPAQRVDLLRRFTGHEVPARTDVIVRGDEGRGLYLVLSGELEVLSGDPPFEQAVARLGPGECFGEIALVRRQPAMATVRARRPSQLLFLAREYFDRLVAALPEMRAFFEELSEERLRRTSAAVELLGDGVLDADEAPLF